LLPLALVAVGVFFLTLARYRRLHFVSPAERVGLGLDDDGLFQGFLEFVSCSVEVWKSSIEVVKIEGVIFSALQSLFR
jgi:hypothetical protein